MGKSRGEYDQGMGISRGLVFPKEFGEQFQPLNMRSLIPMVGKQTIHILLVFVLAYLIKLCSLDGHSTDGQLKKI